jgi:dimethylhistidine N-methyltransferase
MVALARAVRSSPQEEATAAFAAEALAGLKASPKRLPPKFFYDETGSRLFDRITTLGEYYPTRVELGILRRHGSDIAQLLPARGALIEFGSGSSRKARLLLRAAPHLSAYVPVDISAEFLRDEAKGLRTDFPALTITAVEGDFSQPFQLPSSVSMLPRAGFFPGSTIGNFEPHQACTFLRHAGTMLGVNSVLIVGVDRVKDRAVLNAAYNDAQGATAKFNLNMLARLNRELGANFDLDAFEHHAFFNRELSRIEMHLASTRRQKVHVWGETIEFRAGETIHTENSYKYTIESFLALARGSGWAPRAHWSDPDAYFSVHALAFRGEPKFDREPYGD